ncbi:prolipoprotein diacylglyceryl transferase [Thalassotalea castellviae]|uniref:Phosphatidylglycerol--prolipoprotein diacylglyceryl transferase n=1 Tax=Thalassotalea castellviae TaxID=3075612 RepID=A0ABU2ZX39_9GAMM|nr:prolipoprotein diacylglyceryl transferase [Thalassotalea sp. W431]MDT0602481.1 prolipoprotein diacylglyceryl transferase [Thalassotalea sp. W431]
MEHFVWNIDPVMLALGPITIHWYGAIFASSIFAGLSYMKWIYQQENQNVESLDNLLVYVVIGIIVGARLGHCFFYEPSYYFANPLKILAIWEGGLASHGGGLGAIIGSYFYTKKNPISFIWLLDRLAIATALFGIFVRSANFVNAEIIGKATDVPWAVIFQRVDNVARHPAQLYEALAYSLIFISLTIMYKLTKAKNYQGMLLGVFLIMTFTARFVIEFFKQQQATYTIESSLNTGQMLSVPFFLVGVVLVIWSIKHKVND